MVGKPTYDLQQLQQLVGQGRVSCNITEAAFAGAALLGFQESDIVSAVLELGPGDFYKSMESGQCPGLWQDVYHHHYGGVDLYIKLQVGSSGRAIVIQFKKR